MKAVGIIVCTLVIFVGGVLANGYLLSVTWGWFITPIFPTLPNLTAGQCIGLAYTGQLFRGMSLKSEKSDDEDKPIGERMAVWFIKLVLYYALALAAAWVLHRCLT